MKNVEVVGIQKSKTNGATTCRHEFCFLDGEQGVGRPDDFYAARRSDCLRLLPTASSRRPSSTRPIAAPIRLHFRQRPVRLVLRSSLASPPSPVPCRPRPRLHQSASSGIPAKTIMSRDHSSLFHATRSEGQCLHPRLPQAHASADPLRPPPPVSSLRLVSASSAIGQCCCRRRSCCFWSRPPPPPATRVVSGDQRK